MFGVELECGIRSVKVKVKEKDGRVVRKCGIVLAHEFTPDIARAIGKEALHVLDGLRSHALERAVLPVDEMAAIGAFTSGSDAIKIERMVGVKATAISAKDSEGVGPTIHLGFEFTWQEEAWVFLGKHCSATASVVLTQRQLTLAYDNEAN